MMVVGIGIRTSKPLVTTTVGITTGDIGIGERGGLENTTIGARIGSGLEHVTAMDNQHVNELNFLIFVLKSKSSVR